MLHFHIDGLIYGLQPHGGISRVFSNLIEALTARDDCHVTLYLPRNVKTRERLPKSSSTIVYPEVLGLRPRRLFAALNCTRQNRAMNRMWSLARDGVFLSTHYSTYEGVGLPQVQFIQDMIYERFPDMFATDRHRHHVGEKAACIRAASVIITPSNRSLADTGEFYDIAGKSTYVIPYAVDDEFRKTPQPSEIAAFSEKWTSGEPFILHTGSRYLHKNFDALMLAYAQWRHQSTYRLVSVGAGPFTPAETALAIGLGIADRICVVPALPDKQLVTAYHAASAFVFPSLYEGFGFPVIEAIACGTPAAVSNASCLPEVGGATPWYFDPSSADEMCGSIENALQARQSSKDRLLDGIERVRSRTWSDVSEQVVSMVSSAKCESRREY